MRLTTERPAEHRARLDAQWARQKAAEDLRVIRRLAATPEGRQLMANAIDEAREEACAAESENIRQHYLLTA